MELGKSFTGQDFLKALREGTERSSSFCVRLIGMAKGIEKIDDAIAFAANGQCKDWITVPLERIEKIEVLGESPCENHTHPVVELTLRLEASLEASLLMQVSKNNRSTPQAAFRLEEKMTFGGLPIGARIPEHLITSRNAAPADFGCGSGGRPNYVCSSGCACQFPDGYRCCPEWCCYGFRS